MYEVIVVGGGHAGCEASLASARKGHKTLLITGNIKNIADETSEFKTSALMDEFIEDYTKKLWMLKQSIE